ncbi:MAG: hypothetical protein ACP5E7_05585 [Hydrogenobaculum sp.]
MNPQNSLPNQLLGFLPFHINLSSLMYAIIVDTIIYFATIWAMIYISHKYDAIHLRKPAILSYTLLSLFFISIIKFALLSLAFIGIIYLLSNLT